MPLAAALIGGAAVLGGAAIASNATKKASDAATQAAAQNNELQRQVFEEQRSDFAPYRNLGVSAMPEIQRMLGIGAYAPGTNAFAPVASTPVPGVGGVPMNSRTSVIGTMGMGGGAVPLGMQTSGAGDAYYTAPGVLSDGRVVTSPNAFDDGRYTRPDNPQLDAAVNDFGGGAQGAAPAGGGVDWAKVLQDRPDVMAEYQRLVSTADRNSPTWQQHGLDTPETFAQWWYANKPAADTYQAPTVASQPASSLPTPPAGSAAPGNNAFSYGPDAGPVPTAGPRPDATRPNQGVAPSFDTPSMPDLSYAAYQQSPGYNNQLKEGMRGINAYFGAKGVLNSGGALQAAMQFGQDLADQDYNTWRQNQLAEWQARLGQFNTDRAANLNQFNTDRSVLNQNFDVDTARGDARYDTDRNFNYGQWLDQRNYDTSRFDTRYANLAGLLNVGAGATGATGAAGQNYANAFGANNNSAASATGNAAIANANTVNGLIGNAFNAYGMYAGLRGQQTGRTG